MVELNLRRQSGTPDSLRWWGSLPFRLAVAINLTAVVLLGAFWYADYRRERAAHLNDETARLLEEARVLKVAKSQFEDLAQFQQFVDAFCRQMIARASPGHHIVVVDRDGRVVVRAHERADAELEQAMLDNRGAARRRFLYRGRPYLAASSELPDASAIVVAQSLAPVRRFIRNQAISRAVSLGMLAVLIFGVTTVVALVWVRAPLGRLVEGIRAIGRGRFDVRIPPAGAPELRYLAVGVNEMARALGKVERSRQTQMRRARDIQASLLPNVDRVSDGPGVSAVFVPTESVGGDLYDVVRRSDESMLLVLLDVSGHGVPAALYTALLRTVFRYEAKRTSRPAAIMEAMNEEFATVTADAGEFATCFIVRIDGAMGEVEYASAGHDPAIIVRREGDCDRLAGNGFPLGVRPGGMYTPGSSALLPGDRLFLYTDGAHEVRLPGGDWVGRERLVQLIVDTRDRPAAEHADAVLRGVEALSESGTFDDDVTLLCVWRG